MSNGAMDGDGPVTHFNKIINYSSSSKSLGSFQLKPGGISWKATNAVTGSVTINKDNIENALWSQSGKMCMLHIYTKKKNEYKRFDGFHPKNYQVFKDHFYNRFDKLKLGVEKLCSKGINAGDLEYDESRHCLAFKFEDQRVFELNANYISQCAVPGKNEIELQFHEDDTGPREDELLVEMRFSVPPDEDGTDISLDWQAKIADAADIRGVTGDVICELDESVGIFLTPRGKYKIEFYANFLRMHGKTYDYKIMYKSIARMFLLPKPDNYHVAFVISLDDPIRQGQQRYPHLVLQLEIRDEEVKLNLSSEELKVKFDGQLKDEMAGNLPDIVARLFKVLTKKKVFVCGSYESFRKAKGIKSSLKGIEGILYPLQRSFFFIHKPATFIKYEDIETIEFQRIEVQQHSAIRSFDLEVICRAQDAEQAPTYIFNAIDKQEYSNLFNFLNTKKITIKNIKNAANSAKMTGTSSRNRHGGMSSEQLAELNAELGDASEDDSEDDSDFKDNGPSSSSEDEDFDDTDASAASEASDAEGDGGGGDDEGGEGKPKKKKKAKVKKVKSEGMDTATDDGKSSKKRKAPSSATKKSKKKSKKDPNAPKKPLSAFMHFSADQRVKIKEENPDLSFGETSKKCGELWKALNDNDKAKYLESATKDKERFEEEMKSYTPPEAPSDASDVESKSSKKKKTKSSKKKKTKKKKKKDPNLPKKGLSAFMFFSSEKRAGLKESNPEMTFGDTAKKLGEMWKAMSEEEKKPYNENAIKDKERYLEEMKTYTPPENNSSSSSSDDSLSSSSDSSDSSSDDDSD